LIFGQVTILGISFQSRIWFVTGSTGLVGFAIVKKLRSADIDVIALIRLDSNKAMVDKLKKLGVKIIIGDLLDTDSYKLSMATCDGVIHAAAAVQNSDKKTNWDVNFNGAKAITDCMVDFGLKRLIHISTTGVYGQSSIDLIDEDLVPKPIGSYSESKLAAERYIVNNEDKLNVTIFRPPYIIGDLEDDRHVLPTFYRLLQRRILPNIWRRDINIGFVHADDIASAVLLSAALQETPHVIYNIQSFELQYKKLLHESIETVGSNAVIIPLPYSVIFLIGIIIDPIRALFKKPSVHLRKRIISMKNNWSFDTTRIQLDLNWNPDHCDPVEIQNLLYDLDELHKAAVDIDVRDVLK
jgi:nucleoside-diphosphate-sugar epimerase